MDRLDDIGMISRLDREAWFHFVCIWALKRLSTYKPDFVIMSEAPHNHAQFLVFSICNFFKIPILKFGAVMPVPILFSYTFINGEWVKIGFNYKSSSKLDLSKELDLYIDKSLERLTKIGSTAPHLVHQMKLSNSVEFWLDNKKKILKNTFRFLKFPQKWFKTKYDYNNPYQFGEIAKRYFIKKRKIFLKNELKLNTSSKFNLSEPYVYFPLHYEPERTTLPDGGEFQDQFKTICALRETFPNDIKIVIKEHPSQFLPVRFGFKGRSPLFYSLINNLKNVYLIPENTNNSKLIMNSDFVAVISGTAGFEAALLGKKVILFGEAWFKGMPNVKMWHDFKKENSFVITKNISGIKKYFEKEIFEYGVVGFQNLSQNSRYSKFFKDEFYKDQSDNLYKSVLNFMKNYVS